MIAWILLLCGLCMLASCFIDTNEPMDPNSGDCDGA